ncbi:MAG: hypothetical protein RBT69_13280 [Spirochaetia bacterium]|jgi:hypothetical protein|nr:hypothetical protein [Spirochaetia bacterium]
MRNSNKVLLASFVFLIALILAFMIIVKVGINQGRDIKYREKPDSSITNTVKTALADIKIQNIA